MPSSCSLSRVCPTLPPSRGELEGGNSPPTSDLTGSLRCAGSHARGQMTVRHLVVCPTKKAKMTHILFLDQQTKKTIKVSKEMKQKYIVKFTETERSQLKELISFGETLARQIRRAYILPKSGSSAPAKVAWLGAPVRFPTSKIKSPQPSGQGKFADLFFRPNI